MTTGIDYNRCADCGHRDDTPGEYHPWFYCRLYAQGWTKPQIREAVKEAFLAEFETPRPQHDR